MRVAPRLGPLSARASCTASQGRAPKRRALSRGAALKAELIGHPDWPLAANAFVQAHRDLGGDATAGSYRSVATQLEREAAALEQSAKGRRVFRPGWRLARVQRAGPTAKAIWGAAITGVPDARLRTRRSAAVRAAGSMPTGASLEFASLLSGRGWRQDPLVLLVGQAVEAYCHARWERQLDRPVAMSCLKASQEARMHARPWQVVKDPISALSLTLERVGWRFAESSPDVLLDERGREWDVNHFTPACLGGRAGYNVL